MPRSSNSSRTTEALTTLKEPKLAWNPAHQLALDDNRTWHKILKTYQAIDPLAVLPIHTRLVLNDLLEADAKRYRAGASGPNAA
ncbi:hypothetical protein GCM10022223_33330 [Kineosporia mesophila]|uniref:Uncharacterized protein n=1 Tax=Kineosporia mesophila TaxID=566012 RepID=A0ABP6ZNN2_9ACTN|nr:hypothetical protein [Kineosporia mesophila]MCD5353679.1 hypothetical protein [Kineosporia mesophila]